MRLAGQAKGGFYPTPPRVVDMIAEMTEMPYRMTGNRKKEETLRILDPCCGAGDAVVQLAEIIGQGDNRRIETFGVELHQDRSDTARAKMDKVLSVDLFQTAIANGAFGLLLLNPPYDNDPEKGRTERSFLAQCTRYLAENGLLVFIVPVSRLESCARHLAAYYQAIQIWSFPDPEWDDFDQVVLTGYRKRQPRTQTDMEKTIGQWSLTRPEPMDTAQQSTHRPCMTPAGNILFSSRNIDPEEAAREAARAGLWVNPEVTEALWPSETPKTRPLMPLRRGHMAMLIAAGFLNNMKLEDQGTRVLVKGQTVKKKVLVEITEDEEIYQDRLYTNITALNLDTGEIQNIQA